MDTEASSGIHMSAIAPRLFPSLGPTLLICMGYIDPGKWAAAVDGGARFGFDLIFPVLAFNCIAILCQYVSARIAVVTGKNLAQICNEEYSKAICILLGVQAEISVIVLDLTMILGIAHGLNLLFGLDMFICILMTTFDTLLYPHLITILKKCKTEMLLLSLAGSGLIIYLLGVLISQPEIPLVMNGTFPRFRGESAYSLLSLLGASVMPHNLYLHSSIVQQQKSPNGSIGALCHDHFFAIILIFSGIFLANYMVMLSAATIFHSAGLSVLTFQDSLLLMDQVFRSPVVAFAFFLVLLFSSQVTTLTWGLGGHVVIHNLFDIDPPIWIHRATVKALAIIPALYYAWTSGAEGIYQLLIFSQVVLAMLLPTSVIPLFRVGSSRLIMGAFKISGFMEVLALSAFLGMTASNLIFIVEMLFGDSDRMDNIRWNMGSSLILPYFLLLFIACMSLVSMIWLAATPLKSASADLQFQNWDQRKVVRAPFEDRVENDVSKDRDVEDDTDPLIEEEAFEKKFVVSQLDDLPVDFDVDLPEAITDFDQESQQSSVEDNLTVCTIPGFHLTESTSSAGLAPVANEEKVPPAVELLDTTVQRSEPRDLVEKAVEVKEDVHVKDDETDGRELEEEPAVISGIGPIATNYPDSFKSSSSKSDDAGSSSGSVSSLSGLGRAARRQLAAILDEFWGQLFDFHGQLTQEAKGKRMDVLLGLDQKSVASVKPDNARTDYATKYFLESEKAFLNNSRQFDSPKQQRTLSSLDSTYGVQMGSSSWSPYMQSLNACMQNSCGNSFDATERRYSSLRLPTYSEDRNHQPATIHGYQIASYLSRIAAESNMDPLNIPLDPPPCKSTSLSPNYKNQLAFGSLQKSSLPNPAASLINRMQAERSYYDNASLVGSDGNVGESAYPKKYHSLPDISGLVVPNRNPLLAGRSTQLGISISPRLSVSRNTYDQRSMYSGTASRGGPPGFELSPSKVHRNVSPLPSNMDSSSIWSRQPFEQLFGVTGNTRSGGSDEDMQETVPHDSETKLLHSLRNCIMKLLKLDGSEWLFQQSGGYDEQLIDLVAAREKYLCSAEAREVNQYHMSDSTFISSDRSFGPGPRIGELGRTKFLSSPVPRCGEGCIWRMGLIVCFGVWCILRILHMSRVESRPELWGKYTYVLNRLQGILDMAFFKPRPFLSPCFCLQMPSSPGITSGPPFPNELSPTGGKVGQWWCTSASTVLDLIKNVEDAVLCRKGRTGTAAGDVAFPKGKENLASVLKRYKRRLSNKSIGVHEGGTGSRKAPIL